MNDLEYSASARQSQPGFECGSSVRDLIMPPESCTSGGNDCERKYHIYIPTAVCAENSTKISSVQDVGTVPLVFAVHCFGCNGRTMIKWENIAEEFNFIMVRPEGIRSSWNAKYCCGYAVEKDLNDIGFFEQIIDELDGSLELFRKGLVYGLGWSNGGYMVTYSARLFRSIAPISGYQYGDQKSLSPNGSTGLFQHHGLDDSVVQFDGCCTRQGMKPCCCGISRQGADQCTSVEQAFDAWTNEINHCSGVTTTYKDEMRGIECRSGDGCTANTTLCVYENVGHFNRPSFERVFPMFEEVGTFFATDACSLNGGVWSMEKKTCICKQGDSDGIYCSNQKSIVEELEGLYSSVVGQVEQHSGDSTQKSWVEASTLPVAFVCGVGLVLVTFFFLKRRRSKRIKWKKVSISEESEESRDGVVELPNLPRQKGKLNEIE